jgi:putative flavoprotein involved in K+ transport
MPTTGTVVIGAGQAGLAASRHLSARGLDHVVLERGHIGQRWQDSTWDSLHLLTPNWMNALPGRPYRGSEPDGFSSAASFVDELTDYAWSFDAPVAEQVRVQCVSGSDHRFEVVTDQGTWRAASVVIATGWCDRPAVPAMAGSLASDIHQVAPSDYHNPGSLPPGGVLVVGASATGVQLANELRAAGRDVTVAVGSHTRLPREYRGLDIYWWLDRLGFLDKTIDAMPDARQARREPSTQLVGRPDNRTLDLTTLQAGGVRLVGRLVGLDASRAGFASDLEATTAAADARMRRVLRDIDRHIDTNGLRGEVLPARRPPGVTAIDAVTDLDLRAAGIRSVLWATGYRRSYGWLRLPVLDDHGEIRQRRGCTPVAGLYVLGQRFQHYRNSSFIGGVGRDAAFVADQIAGRPCEAEVGATALLHE